ncbi:hypothetical protein [Nostoc piscinale]|nr:hypothetical protein [Nostoc piscinale]
MARQLLQVGKAAQHTGSSWRFVSIKPSPTLWQNLLKFFHS